MNEHVEGGGRSEIQDIDGTADVRSGVPSACERLLRAAGGGVAGQDIVVVDGRAHTHRALTVEFHTNHNDRRRYIGFIALKIVENDPRHAADALLAGRI